MKIKILSDSTCDLSQELIEKNNITLIPLTIIKDGVPYQDSVTITPADIFAHVAAGGGLCSTTAINVGEYEEFFSKFTDEYDGVVHINIGSGFSSSHQNACLAAESFENVRVIDSRNLTTGQGFVVLYACKIAKECNSLDELCEKVNAYTEKIEVSFLLDRLDYMVKGGRCSSAAALGANLLNLKPCIEVKNGKLGVVKKYRGNYSKCLSAYIKDRITNRDDLDRETLFVTRTRLTDECMKSISDTIQACADFENVYWTEAGCTVSCHCGPGTMGVIFVRK